MLPYLGLVTCTEDRTGIYIEYTLGIRRDLRKRPEPKERIGGIQRR